MIRQMAALILLSSVLLSQTQELPEQIQVTVVKLGDDLTLTCPIQNEGLFFFYWYRLKFGYILEKVVNVSFGHLKLVGKFNNSRFISSRVYMVFTLTIKDVRKDDEAMYFCEEGVGVKSRIINGTLLTVKGPEKQKNSPYVKQSPSVEWIQPGASVDLKCSLVTMREQNRDGCERKHMVHWFRAGSESHIGVIYNDSECSDEGEEQRCVYRLSKVMKDASDAGTYYCAVVTCAEILLGDGTVLADSKWDPAVIILGVLLVLSLTVIAILVFSKGK